MDSTNPASLSQFAACVGLDWADGKHDVCLQAADSERREAAVIDHRPEAIDAWALALRERFDARPVAVVLELAKGPIVYAPRKYDFIVLFPINPASLAKYRKLFTHSGAKDDPTDAEFALDFLLKHPERLQPLNPQSDTMRAVEQYVEMRRTLVNDQVRITNRITSALKNYFPQPLQWFNDKNTVVFCDFLTRWPTLKQARNARRSSLEKFFHEHNVVRPAVVAKRIEAIKSATPLTDDRAVIEPGTRHGRGPGRAAARDPRGHRAIRTTHRTARPEASGLPHLQQLPGRRPGVRAAIVGCLRRAARALPLGHRHPDVLRRRARHRAQRKLDLGALAMAVSEVHAANLRRVGRTDDSTLGMGRRLLSTTETGRQITSCRAARAGIQMDPHLASMLGHRRTLRREHRHQGAPAPRLADSQVHRRAQLNAGGKST